MDSNNVSAKIRYVVYGVMILGGGVFFFLNENPMLWLMGLGVAVVCTLALLLEPVIAMWDRKRQRDGMVDLEKDKN